MTFVIVGGGLAGASAAAELRDSGYDGPLVLFAAEQHPPYHRPPLSKGYLAGDRTVESTYVHPPEWYAEHEVDLRTATPVTTLDLAARVVRTAVGEQPFTRLLLATGATPRRLPMAEESGVPVAYLRTLEDSDRLRASFGEGRRLVIVGGGWIGLEVAAAARAAGTEVTVLESAAQPLLAVLGPEVARVFADKHRREGVDLRTGVGATQADLAGADLVLVGIGAAPSVELAAAAGLAVDNGVLVDARLRTSDPDVVAAGDLANHDHPVLGRRVRVEHWDNAAEQGKVAARTMLGGEEDYTRLPYFFTDQYDLGMEYFGHGSADDEVVVVGDTDGVFRAYWVADGTVVAAMHVNDWDASDEVRATVGRSAADLPGRS